MANNPKQSENYGFGHIYSRNSEWKTSFFVQRLSVPRYTYAQ